MLAVLLLARMSKKRRNSVKKPALNEQIRTLDVTENVYCRTCLNTKHLTSIFYSSDKAEKIVRDFHTVTGLEIKINDGLSQKICGKCMNILNIMMDFRKMCKRAQKTLHSLLPTQTKPAKRKKYANENNFLRTHPSKYLEDELQLKTESTATEDIDYYDDIQDFMDGDDFQNDELFDCKDDVKPILDMKEEQLPITRQKAPKVPNASSYKCATCSKEFKMKATYKSHMRFHTNYCVCESCGKRCRNNNQLQEHKRARHGLGRIHKCAYCEYSSATKEALVIHERRHTGERPYICDHCGASFHRRSNLVQHIAIHLPDKNFQCSFCPTREKSKKRLQIHISKAHRTKQYSYKCPRCNKQFRRNEHTHRHLIRVHHLPRPFHPPIDKVLVDSCHSDRYVTADANGATDSAGTHGADVHILMS